MDNPLLKQARECPFNQGALRALAGCLPADDQTLDRLLAEAVAAKDELAFTHLMLATLEAGRKADARHLIEGATLIPEVVALINRRDLERKIDRLAR